MADDTVETIRKSFQEASSGLPAGTDGADAVGRAVATLANDLPTLLSDAVREVAATTAAATTPGTSSWVQPVFNYPATGVPGNAASAAASSGGDSTASSVLSTVLKTGLGMVPLVSGILSLFRGGEDAAPPPLVKYAAPPAASFEAAEWGSQTGNTDYDQAGLPRLYPGGGAAGTSEGAANAGTYGASAGPGSSAPPAPVVTVNVQAMDSQSFLDHSQEIARAVRDAMLNLNAINDVVNDL